MTWVVTVRSPICLSSRCRAGLVRRVVRLPVARRSRRGAGTGHGGGRTGRGSQAEAERVDLAGDQPALPAAGPSQSRTGKTVRGAAQGARRCDRLDAVCGTAATGGPTAETGRVPAAGSVCRGIVAHADVGSARAAGEVGRSARAAGIRRRPDDSAGQPADCPDASGRHGTDSAL